MTSSLLALTGCATATVTGETDVYCKATRFITWSGADTDQTIREAKAHNAVRLKLCGAAR